ncbi:hypothetical protein D0Z00_000527 [Geotrichum galactomycetum]|uniref:Uncharacterized protein n=1 Tax=Geotrichum galactomycetum TaxID=27317 RepID=A0ACB6V9Y4_9ASCO|nr:hypothetical protein D0Z00_000527 [Geotrichum candidum]
MSPSTPPSDGLLQVGDHCNFCNDLDFLPFTCDDCGNVFCQQHRKPDSHSCSQKLKKQQQQSKQPSKPASMTTVAPTKYTRPAAAPTNGRRLGSSPAGTPPPPANGQSTQAAEKSNNNKAALEKLKSLWGSSNKSSKSTPSSSSQTSSSGSNLFSGWKKPSLSAQLRTSRAQELKLLNQLKRDAKGDAKIELSHRRYLYFESAATGKKVPVYHRDDIITGKLLDKAAEALNINLRTANSSAAGGKMALYIARTQQFLPYNEKLSTALGGAVKDGDTLILKLKPDSA